jgi:hypothetical protein
LPDNKKVSRRLVARRASREAKSMREESSSDEDTSSNEEWDPAQEQDEEDEEDEGKGRRGVGGVEKACEKRRKRTEKRV